jgi:hypothetical protein
MDLRKLEDQILIKADGLCLGSCRTAAGWVEGQGHSGAMVCSKRVGAGALD